MVLVGLLALTVATGCLSDDEAGDRGLDGSSPDGALDRRTLNLTSQTGLVPGDAPEGSVPLEGSMAGFATRISATVFASQPLDEPLLIGGDAVNLTVWLEADPPTPTNPETTMIAILGSTQGFNLEGTKGVDLSVMTPGEPIEIQVELPFEGKRPLVVPAGERLKLLLASPNNAEEAENLHVLTGGERASSIEMAARSLPVDALGAGGDEDAERIEGRIVANSQPVLPDCQYREGVTMKSHELTVGEDINRLGLDLTASRSPGNTDLDLQLVQDGEVRFETTSPWANETMLLAGPSLDGLRGEELTLRVYGCQAAATDYTVGVRQAPFPDPSGAPLSAREQAQAPVERIELSRCYEQGTVFGPPRNDFFRDAVPTGFELVPFADEPTNRTATFIANALRCTTEDGRTVQPLWFFLQVDPPERLANPDAVRHLLALQSFTEDDRLTNAFEAWGTASGRGADRVTFDVSAPAPSARTGQTGAVRDEVEVELTTSVSGPPAPQTAGTARVFGAENGSLTGAMDVAWTASPGGFEDGSGALTIQGTGPVGLPLEAGGAGLAWHHWGQGFEITLEPAPLAGGPEDSL